MPRIPLATALFSEIALSLSREDWSSRTFTAESRYRDAILLKSLHLRRIFVIAL